MTAGDCNFDGSANVQDASVCAGVPDSSLCQSCDNNAVLTGTFNCAGVCNGTDDSVVAYEDLDGDGYGGASVSACADDLTASMTFTVEAMI
jgi:hypothetical protein